MKLADFILYLTDTWQVPSGSRQVPQGKEKTPMSIPSGDALVRSSKAGCEALRIIFSLYFLVLLLPEADFYNSLSEKPPRARRYLVGCYFNLKFFFLILFFSF
jgi:hypothetical protein